MPGLTSTPQGRLLRLFFDVLACGLFDDLRALDSDARAAWIERWSAQNPPTGTTFESFMTKDDLARADEDLREAGHRQHDYSNERGCH